MRKPDEIELFNRIKNKSEDQTVREIVNEMGMNWKRAYYILTKWCGQDLYNYGVSPFAGWLEVEELPNE
jgi:hypothetical protein